MTSSSSAPLLLADPIPRAEAHSQVPAVHTHRSLVRSWPPRTADQQEMYEKRQAEAKRLFEEQQEEAKTQQELATQRGEQERQARRHQEQIVAQRLEQERQTRIEQERARIREQEEQARQRREEEKREKDRAFEEVKRRTKRYKFNITTENDKKRLKKIASTEPVFVMAPDVAAEYRRLRQEAAKLMHQYGPFSASATAAHKKFEEFNEIYLTCDLPALGREYEEESGRIV